MGFVGTGYVVLFVLLINYLIAYDPKPGYVHAQSQSSYVEPGFKPNPIDIKFLNWARGKVRRVMRLAPDSWTAFATNLDFSVALRKVGA